MPTRRTILESAAALSAAPLAPKVVFAGGSKPAANMGVLYDHRHPAARAFRLRSVQWDVPVAATHDGEVTALWQEVFRASWKNAPQPLAGLTERPALFILEELGRDYGMRVFFQAEHEPQGQGRWAHRLLRAASNGTLEGALTAAGSDWPAVLADQLLTAPEAVASKDLTPSGAAMAAHPGEPEKLYSWIIAPRSVAQHI